jgi:hypothetical protein
MERCKFKQGKFNCGSYAFNLYKEGIDQGDFCDHHYWQDQAMKARAGEREACAKVCEELGMATNGMYERNHECAAAIRARSNT